MDAGAVASILLFYGGAVVILASLSATVYGFFKYRGQDKPTWLIALTIILPVMIVPYLYLFLMMWSVTHGE